MRPLAPATVERIRAALDAEGAAIVSVLAYSGLRPGKLRALRWGDVRERTILVQRGADPDGNAKATKTRAVRTVRLLVPLAADLKEWRMASGRPPADALVFAREDGEAWTKDEWDVFRANGWHRACKAARLDAVPRPYDLRHSFASLLLAEGRTVHYVAAQLGHSPALTLSTYGHLIAEYADAGADRRGAGDRAGACRSTHRRVRRTWPTGGEGGTVYLMTTKDRLHQVVDAMSEQEAVDALDILVSRTRDPLARRLDAAPLDDEPLTVEERESLREGREDVAAGRVISMDDLRRELG